MVPGDKTASHWWNVEYNTPVTLIVLLILISAFPYVAWIRHPSQKLLAAYLIFAVIFLATFLFLFNALIYLLGTWGLSSALEQTVPLLLLLAFVLAVSFALASWQARKPHVTRKPP